MLPARALRSCCCEFDRDLGPQLLARAPLQKKKKKIRHAQNSSFVEKRSFASQAVDPDFRLTVFANEKSSPEPVICGLRLTLPASPSHFRENLIAFCPLEFCCCLSETASKARQALVSLALFPFFFLLKKASARFSKCASRDILAPSAACGRTRPDPADCLHACSRDRCVSDHVQSTSGRRRGSPASRLGARVKIKTAWDLSKLKRRNAVDR